MRIQEDDGNSMDDAVPTRANAMPASNPAVPSDHMHTIGDLSDWMPLPEHTNALKGHEVQRTLQGLAIGEIQQPAGFDMNSTSYGNSGSSNDTDTGMSPSTNSTSNRPTPNDSTSSDSRTKSNAGQNSSGRASYETSPDVSDNTRLPATDGRAFSSFFSTQPDYSATLPSTGLTPDNTFSMPDTPGRGFDVPSGWEMSNQGTTGLTPVGEGVFRQLLGLGPMDAM